VSASVPTSGCTDAQGSLVVISLTDIVFGESYELTQRKLYCPTNVKYL